MDSSDPSNYGSDAESETVFSEADRMKEERASRMFPELKIISKACEFPGMSLVARVSKPLLSPLQNVAQQSLLPLGAQLVDIVDGRMSDGSRQWVLKTKEKLVTVVETTDSIACNCLDTVTLRRRVVCEETIIRQV